MGATLSPISKIPGSVYQHICDMFPIHMLHGAGSHADQFKPISLGNIPRTWRAIIYVKEETEMLQQSCGEYPSTGI